MNPVMFDHEKLDVYQLELQFMTWVTPILEDAIQSGGRKAREVCDHLNRASMSILLNTAEGNGKRQRLVRSKFFDDARGSATECAACLDVLVAKGVFTKERTNIGKSHLLRIIAMLTKLIQLYEGKSNLKEDPLDYLTCLEYEI